ncbi:hypothetical protein ABIA31_008786 [Catenulispora sp. MAP5-51]|uniref:hypothetical protein n=1 Tax=Catenulispora sp. MAP5-51 TaxID=3156298 RepID=UPI003511BA52
MTNRPWTPAVDGIRDFTGKTNPDGSVTLYATTTSVGGVSDYGADPNKLVTVTDQASATTAPAGAQFRTLQSAAACDVLRGVSFTPGS